MDQLKSHKQRLKAQSKKVEYHLTKDMKKKDKSSSLSGKSRISFEVYDKLDFKKPIFGKPKNPDELNIQVRNFNKIKIKIRPSTEKSKINVGGSIERPQVDLGSMKDKKDKNKSSSSEDKKRRRMK
jgi:hypothetical protein